MQLLQYCIVVPPANSKLFPRYTCLPASFGCQGRKVSDTITWVVKILKIWFLQSGLLRVTLSCIPGTCSCPCWSHRPLWCDSAGPEYWSWSWEDLFLPGSGYHHQNLQGNHWNLGEFDNYTVEETVLHTGITHNANVYFKRVRFENLCIH